MTLSPDAADELPEDLRAAALELARLVQILRGEDWHAAMSCVTEQLEALPTDDAHALLLLSLLTLAAHDAPPA